MVFKKKSKIKETKMYNIFGKKGKRWVKKYRYDFPSMREAKMRLRISKKYEPKRKFEIRQTKSIYM